MLWFLKRMFMPTLFFADEAESGATLAETLETAEKEEAGEPGKEESSAAEQGSQEEKSEEDAKLQELDDDDDFKAEQEALEKDKGGKLSLGELKRFKTLYWKVKEGERQSQGLQSQLEELQGKETTDNEILGEAHKRGLLPKKEKGEDIKKEPVKFDEVKFLETVPEEERENARRWLGTFKQMIDTHTMPLKQELNQYKQEFGDLTIREQAKELTSLEDETKQFVEDKFKLNWEKDVLPEVKKLATELARRLPQGVSLADVGWNPKTLAKQVLADKGYDFAKKTLAVEAKKEAVKKKQANVETETSPEAGSGSDDDKSLREIHDEEMQKEGLARFE